MPVDHQPIDVEVQPVGARRDEVLVELLHRSLADQVVLTPGASSWYSASSDTVAMRRLHVERGLGLHVLQQQLEVAPQLRVGLGGEALLDLGHVLR